MYTTLSFLGGGGGGGEKEGNEVKEGGKKMGDTI